MDKESRTALQELLGLEREPAALRWFTYGFADVGSRAYMSLGPDSVMASIPGSALARIVSNLREMRSKKAFGA